ncbi:spore coat protein [Desulfallas thermosapovorans]|uniref:Coat F domain-containing protein n=1 Tax=Desulfallas thermosapovorans DSM 6562 TaxID=1121431 RepID=A0A5S4ZNT4_9FIRM|nr:spore coat protein [Desulfallas thermosapovorans]TYO94499.1 coat F domain-containing protein [Desulfallas thermosapovorans DSM 6562]
MKFTDMDMLQDYEKDTRMAALAYALVETEIIDPNLRKIMGKAAASAAQSQQKFLNLIIKKGDRP